MFVPRLESQQGTGEHSRKQLGPCSESRHEVIFAVSHHYSNLPFKAQQPGLFLDWEFDPGSAVYWRCDLEQMIACLFAFISLFIKTGVTPPNFAGLLRSLKEVT